MKVGIVGTGRIGLAVSASNPNVVYAMLEAKEGTLYRSDDKGENFRQVYRQQNIVGRGFYYTTVKVDPTDENRVYAIATQLYVELVKNGFTSIAEFHYVHRLGGDGPLETASALIEAARAARMPIRLLPVLYRGCSAEGSEGFIDKDTYQEGEE